MALAPHKAWAEQIGKALGCRLNGRKDNVEKIVISLDNCITWMCLEYSIRLVFKGTVKDLEKFPLKEKLNDWCYSLQEVQKREIKTCKTIKCMKKVDEGELFLSS